MEVISLKEAAALVSKDSSTIRKYFSKPENKQFRQIRKGKIYVSKEQLLKYYEGEESSNVAQIGTDRNSLSNHELPPKIEEDYTKVVTELRSQISELKADKENFLRQINDQRQAHREELVRLHERVKESHIIAQTTRQELQQHNPRSDQEQANTKTTEALAGLVDRKDKEIAELNKQLQEAGKSTKIDYVLIAVILVLVAALVVVMLIK